MEAEGPTTHNMRVIFDLKRCLQDVNIDLRMARQECRAKDLVISQLFRFLDQENLESEFRLFQMQDKICGERESSDA